MDLALHIGAHRTGTTSLQQGLRKAAEALAPAGVTVWGPDQMRVPGRHHHARNLRRAASDPEAARAAAAARDEVAAALAALVRGGCRRLVISEENLLGTMEGNFAAAALYPHAARNLAAARDLLGRAPGEVVLAVRDYAGYWTSAYAQCVLMREMPAFDGPALTASARGWPDVVADVAASFPEARLTVLGYGADCAAEVLEALLPGGLAGSVRLPARQSNAALSARGLRKFAALRRRTGPFDPARRRATVTEMRKIGGPPFQPFDDAEVEALSARFEEDWSRIAGLGVRLVGRGEVVR
ncbi:MAG: hypothetical protein MUE98_12220 [Rhodobacteraceae bacterium]|jgi:hypothetical protein|nr:hypothetical protein [Paracoccaceae bacterium]